MAHDEEFADRVMVRLNQLTPEGHTIGHEEAGMLRGDAARLARLGYTEDDAVSLLKNTEEVNPEIPEAEALRRMAKITSKY